mmetsp:Transcript_6715/g.15361  ORF Transcript_6715/g.15361 Transcript_6715/m.15361 type:complete len:1436 (+) Transcript_6715:45-4352(+)
MSRILNPQVSPMGVMLSEMDTTKKVQPRGLVPKLLFQIKLLLWKRYLESTKSKWDLLKVIIPALLIFALVILCYSQFTFFSENMLEPFLVPFAFWIFIQRLVVHIMFEKSSRLQESMRMMGLSDLAYWTSYVISDGVVLGFLLSFLCTIFTVGGLFQGANFGVILGFLFVFCLAAVPFSFFLTAFFDTPQTSGQATLGVLLASYVMYIVIFPANALDVDLKSAQTICCFFPPLALQVGSGAFLKSYAGIPISQICGILVADIFIYGLLAWYFSQVWPSQVGVAKPFYFVFLPSYWFPKSHSAQPAALPPAEAEEDGVVPAGTPTEAANEELLGAPTVVVNKLRKTFGSQVSVNDLSFSMYENQIFALLGHNGAGKTTCISMLTGLIAPDFSMGDNGAQVYGSDILTEMESVRGSLGICPQHDVLFESLTVREHILFFAQLKGASYDDANRESAELTTLFHLDERLDHLGNELSGGQRRKLSVAIAVCGGSKFVVLDEPTAGMDPLARRELWDLLASLRKGRTMLLTTHYMDEADVLGDRVGIMSLGQMQCVGSTQFLKSTYGAGYKLIFDKGDSFGGEQLAALTAFVHQYVPQAVYIEEDGAEEQALYTLPFHTVASFGPFFTALDSSLEKLCATSYGVTITSLEDVFLKVGEDHTVKPNLATGHGIGKDRAYQSNIWSQIIGICKRKLTYCLNDFITVALVVLPAAVGIAAAVLYAEDTISKDDFIKDLITAGMYIGAFLGAPGLIAEFIVKERNDKLRNVLTVMGCDFRAYWIGTLLADYLILAIPMGIIWITWFSAGMTDFYASKGGLNFFMFLLFNLHLISFSYFFSFIFSTPKSCISLMPILIIMLIILPNIVLLILIIILSAAGLALSTTLQGGILLWGVMFLTPHGALFCSFLNTTADFSAFITGFPPISACIITMLVESFAFLAYAYMTDAETVAAMQPGTDPLFNPRVLENLDEDVAEERNRVLGGAELGVVSEKPLRIERLRKVFAPKRVGQPSVVAAQDVAFSVGSGEIFGLLGANGAGKTTVLSMLTRHLVPTSGDAFVANHSILSDFNAGATHLGVVTQNNSLWDRLSVEAHLKLFARLRGVPEDLVKQVVDGTIDQLELTPHRHKLAMRLSGGMKRKLCVAIALIGDPEVVLLDEPSAGLDPVSRRNLWSVILRTMSHRAVILTTHSMDEAEALCKRIGIMVKGQLRALGTKQHLKNKFGSGFELVVKLSVAEMGGKHEQLVLDMSAFVQGMFPSSTLISENGGLLTYDIPPAEMKMGLAFSQLEARKQQLCIEDYSVAQPTLEQVFIRTVNKHTDVSDRAKNAGGATVVGGSGRMSVEGTHLLDAELPEHSSGQFEEQIFGEVQEDVNKCGCTNKFTSYVVLGLFLGFIAFFGIFIGVSTVNQGAASAFIILTVICLVALIISCCVRYCAFCQYPKGADE